jgi:hypothetical protein
MPQRRQSFSQALAAMGEGEREFVVLREAMAQKVSA